MNSLGERIVIAIYVGAFSVATAVHSADVMRWGWLPYGFAPLPLNLFWTSLLILDPMVVGLLLLGWRRSGLALATAIMLLDVAANSYALFALRFQEFAVALQLQTAFLGFILGSIGFLWRSPQGR